MKTFTLFKRPDRNDHYWVRFAFRGQRVTRCTETADAKEAQKVANTKYNSFVEGVKTGEVKQIEATKIRHATAATYAELFKVYASGPSVANSATRASNCRALVREIGGSTVRDLTPEAARNYFTKVNAAALAAPDQAQAASIRRTGNGVWGKMSGLFLPTLLEHYKQNKVYHPTMEEFIKTGQLAKFRGRTIPKVVYNPPTDEIISNTLAAWDGLATTDRNLYLAIGFHLSFGLRRDELAQMTWSWLTERNDVPVIDHAAKVKNNTGWIQVRALDPYYSQMQTQITLNGWRGEPEAFVIGGFKTYRKTDIYRDMAKWLHALGWRTRKTSHAHRERKHIIAMVTGRLPSLQGTCSTTTPCSGH